MFLKKRRQSVLMVATDVYRPAAIDQLVKLGSKVDVPVFELGTSVSPVEIARQGVAKAKAEGVDVVIVDTAGRLQVRCGGCWVENYSRSLVLLRENVTSTFACQRQAYVQHSDLQHRRMHVVGQ